MSAIKVGDRIYSRRHRSGEIHVDVTGSKVLIGRVVRKDGTVGDQEVIVSINDVSQRRLLLPGIGAPHV